jgi:hypothetical protein
MPRQPSALIVPAVKKHTATVIMAHGLGDSGAGWVTLAENWRRRAKFEEVKFIFPNAPAIPITVVCLTFLPKSLKQEADSSQNFGMQMPGWYDIVRPREVVRSLTCFTIHRSPKQTLANTPSYRPTSATSKQAKTNPVSSNPAITSTPSSKPKSTPAYPPTASYSAASHKGERYPSSAA